MVVAGPASAGNRHRATKRLQRRNSPAGVAGLQLRSARDRHV